MCTDPNLEQSTQGSPDCPSNIRAKYRTFYLQEATPCFYGLLMRSSGVIAKNLALRCRIWDPRIVILQRSWQSRWHWNQEPVIIQRKTWRAAAQFPAPRF